MVNPSDSSHSLLPELEALTPVRGNWAMIALAASCPKGGLWELESTQGSSRRWLLQGDAVPACRNCFHRRFHVHGHLEFYFFKSREESSKQFKLTGSKITGTKTEDRVIIRGPKESV